MTSLSKFEFLRKLLNIRCVHCDSANNDLKESPFERSHSNEFLVCQTEMNGGHWSAEFACLHWPHFKLQVPTADDSLSSQLDAPFLIDLPDLNAVFNLITIKLELK